MSASFLRKQFLCRFQLCQTFKLAESSTHLWGECQICGKRAGEISREAIRRYIEAEERWENWAREASVPTPTNPNRSEG